MEELVEHILTLIIDWTMRITEYIGVIILLVAVIRGLIEYIRKKPKAVEIMGEGMTTSLSFLLAGEILRTVTVGTILDIAIVAGIIALRTAIIFIIRWERRNPIHRERRAPAPEEGEEGEREERSLAARLHGEQ